MNSENSVKVDWVEVKREKVLGFEFRGHFDEDLCGIGIQRWEECLLAEPEMITSHKVLWNCKHMDSFEPAARKVWQRTMAKYKAEIQQIYLIAPNNLIATFAKAFGLVMGFKMIPTSEGKVKSIEKQSTKG